MPRYARIQADEIDMEYRQLGRSGLKVPEICFGSGTFGAGNDFFKALAETTQAEAERMVDICMEAGVNFFDTADIYSDGASEQMQVRRSLT